MIRPSTPTPNPAPRPAPSARSATPPPAWPGGARGVPAAQAALAALVLLAAGCQTAPPASPPPPPPPGVVDLLARPAERALLDGMRAYEDAQYPQAETALRRALAAGLANPRDRANAHKLLAFITCTSERLAECAAQFVAARRADPGFQLSKPEAGHPVWGPVYQRSAPP